jgi:hypothetical protein
MWQSGHVGKPYNNALILSMLSVALPWGRLSFQDFSLTLELPH